MGGAARTGEGPGGAGRPSRTLLSSKRATAFFSHLSAASCPGRERQSPGSAHAAPGRPDAGQATAPGGTAVTTSGAAQEQFYLRARFSRVNPLRMLSIDPRHRQLFAELGLNSFESVTRLVGCGQAPNLTTVLVKPTTLAPPSGSRLPVFYKQYELNPASWVFIGRCSKACREFQNYAVFTGLGIACAE